MADDPSEAEKDRLAWIEWDRIEKAQRHPDAQEFRQVEEIGALLGTVTVQYVLLGGHFLARCWVWREGLKRRRKLWMTHPTRAGALEALAGAVAAWHYPPEGKKR